MAQQWRTTFDIGPGSPAEEGDWVVIRGRVGRTKTPVEGEMPVWLRSHAEEYEALVRIEDVDHADPPKDWPACTALHEIKVRPDSAYYERCTRPRGHAGQHEALEGTWGAEETKGWIEEG